MTTPINAETLRRVIPDTSIDPNRLYRADEIAARMGWRPSGWRAARRAGLRSTRYGKHYFCLGKDVVEFIANHAETT
jgi:hypothetical protein